MSISNIIFAFSLYFYKHNYSQICAYKCNISSKSLTNLPRARTWLRAVATVKTTTHIRNDMAVFTVRATQYVSGSRSTVKLADFDILVLITSLKKPF